MLFGKRELVIPSPEEFMSSPSVVKYRKQKYEDYVRLILRDLEQHYTGTGYVRIGYCGYGECPMMYTKAVQAFAAKGWIIIKAVSRETEAYSSRSPELYIGQGPLPGGCELWSAEEPVSTEV